LRWAAEAASGPDGPPRLEERTGMGTGSACAHGSVRRQGRKAPSMRCG
jgi:hypothetical protein